MHRKRWDSLLPAKLVTALVIFAMFANMDKHGHVPKLVLIEGGAAFISVLLITFWFIRRKHLRFRLVELAGVDQMSGMEFEKYVAGLLRQRGYRVRLTSASGDQGADIIAEKDSYSYSIQCKRHNRYISRLAVSDATGAMRHYQCQRSMVITNQLFTDGAIALARSNDCILVDREELARWINQEQAKQAAYARSDAKRTRIPI